MHVVTPRLGAPEVSPTPPTLPRGSIVARTWVVSWLRAVAPAFPGSSPVAS